MKYWKSTITLSIMIFLSLGCGKEDAYNIPEGLLLGMSFEKGPNDLRLGRFWHPSDQYELKWSTEESYDGDHSLKIESNSTENNGFAFWSIRILDFDVNDRVSLTIRVKTINLSGKGFQVSMFARSKSGTSQVAFERSPFMVSTMEKWETIVLTPDDPLTDDVSFIDVYLIMSDKTEGSVYFDKLEVHTI